MDTGVGGLYLSCAVGKCGWSVGLRKEALYWRADLYLEGRGSLLIVKIWNGLSQRRGLWRFGIIRCKGRCPPHKTRIILLSNYPCSAQNRLPRHLYMYQKNSDGG